ncbi:hypothetical protein FPV16_09890 [Methylobacterium sp. W2]|uniref:hypothetical protein n=1 Tax=Methylobacterium sp. W2 TaxID=2598107 RepID=UPI001D0C71A5|nr:hypothetical protein [Methylobacterium sp. W2]MCC0806526.1 hypothetical protein [Methylobacterium sp. W2]
MLLSAWMRTVRLTNRELAEKIGGISADGVNKLRYRQRGPSIRVAARLFEITSGKVGMADLMPCNKPKQAKASVAAEADRA